MTRSQGVHGDGARDFTPEEYQSVVRLIVRMEPGEKVTVAQVSDRTGVSGRAVRDIVSQADGRDFLLGGDGNGYARAACSSDAERLNKRWMSQITKMAERLGRRYRLERQLFRNTQAPLFDRP